MATSRDQLPQQRDQGAILSWEALCARPELEDLPYKIETDDEGHILMTPTKNYHGSHQAAIVLLLDAQGRGGHVVTECAIHTPRGTKVADVAWMTDETWRIVADEAECSVCPEVCIEVKSDSNTEAGLRRKRELYFEQGALEVWECRRDGALRFYRRDDATAWLFPDFPKTIDGQ